MTDRGLLAPGMAADVVVFDPATVIDRATYQNPGLRSEGIHFVMVNGVVALDRSEPTGARGGKALLRSMDMPSRPVNDAQRGLRVEASAMKDGSSIEIDLTHRRGARQATGTLKAGGLFEIERLGVLETAKGWAHVTGIDKRGRAIDVIVDLHNPDAREPALVVRVDGEIAYGGGLPASRITIR
jgi:hypothetical protein